jgi:hypothetical protein
MSFGMVGSYSTAFGRGLLGSFGFFEAGAAVGTCPGFDGSLGLGRLGSTSSASQYNGGGHGAAGFGAEEVLVPTGVFVPLGAFGLVAAGFGPVPATATLAAGLAGAAVPFEGSTLAAGASTTGASLGVGAVPDALGAAVALAGTSTSGAIVAAVVAPLEATSSPPTAPLFPNDKNAPANPNAAPSEAAAIHHRRRHLPRVRRFAGTTGATSAMGPVGPPCSAAAGAASFALRASEGTLLPGGALAAAAPNGSVVPLPPLTALVAGAAPGAPVVAQLAGGVLAALIAIETPS